MKGSYNAYEHWQKSQRQHSYLLHVHGTYIHYLAQNPVLQKPYQLPLDHGYAVSPSSDRVCSVHTSRCHTSPDNTQAASAIESLPHHSLHECSFPLIRFSVFLLLLKSYIYLHISLNKKEDEYKLHFIRSKTVCAFVIFIKNKYTDYVL